MLDGNKRDRPTDLNLHRFFWAIRFLILSFAYFFVSGPCARLSWPSFQLFGHTLIYVRIVSYRILIAAKWYSPRRWLFWSFPVIRQYRRPRQEIIGCLSRQVIGSLWFLYSHLAVTMTLSRLEEVTFFSPKNVLATSGNYSNRLARLLAWGFLLVTIALKYRYAIFELGAWKRWTDRRIWALFHASPSLMAVAS